MRTSVHACVRDVFAIYDDNILSRLIMKIIKMIILYFIQIRHTDYFPSAGIHASTRNNTTVSAEELGMMAADGRANHHCKCRSM